MSIKSQAKQEDHEAIRNRVGYYDFTHHLVGVTGPDAAKFLDIIFVNSIGTTKVGGAQYTTMLNEKGIIIDDVIVARFAEDKYWVSTLDIESMLRWFDAHRDSFHIEYKDISPEFDMYAVQGPKSRAVLNKILSYNIDDMKWFTIRDNEIGNVPVKVARAGFTGELGFEVYIHPSQAEMLVTQLEEAGQEFGIRKITTDAILSSLPVEKGYVLMTDLEGTNPLEAAFGWSVDWDTDFIGKEALLKAKEKGVKCKLRGYILDTDAEDVSINAHATVKAGEEEVGRVTNFTYGFTVGKYIGYALVNPNKVHIGDKVTIDSNGKEYRAEITERIFYDVENTRLQQT